MISYREAVPSDIIDLIELVTDYCQEIGFEHDMSSIKKYLDAQLGRIPAIVAVDDGKVVGAISFSIMAHPFKNDQYIAKKISCFIKEDYREKGVGTQLIKYAEDASRTAGSKYFFFSSTKPLDGYKEFETEYYREL